LFFLRTNKAQSKHELPIRISGVLRSGFVDFKRGNYQTLKLDMGKYKCKGGALLPSTSKAKDMGFFSRLKGHMKLK